MAYVAHFLSVFALAGAALGAPVVAPVEVATADFPPFRIVGEGGSLTGSDAEIVAGVFERMKVPIHINVGPWKRIYTEGTAGKYAAVYSFSRNAEREESYYFSAPINSVSNVFFKRNVDSFTWKVLNDVSGKTIGISASYNYGDEFAAFVKTTQPKLEPSFGERPEEELLAKLGKKRIDLFVCEVSVCSWLVKTRGSEFGEIDHVERPIGKVLTFHVGFPKKAAGSEKLRDQFNAALAGFCATGACQKIYGKYGMKPVLKKS